MRLFVLFDDTAPPVLDDPAPLRAALAAQQLDEGQPPAVELRGAVPSLPGVEALAVTLDGDRHFPVLFHPNPLPEALARVTVGSPQVPEATALDLRTARAHAEIAALGDGTDAAPLERLAGLYRVAMALLEVAGTDDGLGLANPQTWSAYHRRALLPAFTTPQAWTRLKEEGMPVELAVGFLTIRDGQQTWCATRGMPALGLPELAYQPGPGEDVARARTIFNSVFHYLVARGALSGQKVLGAGHTMELSSKEGARMRFSAPRPEHGPVVQALAEEALVIELEGR